MNAARPFRLASFLPLLFLVACGGDTAVTGERGPDGDTAPQTNEPPRDIARCADRIAQARPFGLVTAEAQQVTRNDCGDVAYVTLSGEVAVQRIEMTTPLVVGKVPSTAASKTRLALAATGKYLAYFASDGAHRVALDTREGEEIFAANEDDELGFVSRPESVALPAADRLVLCGRTGGFRLAGAPNDPATADCQRLQATGGAHALARLGGQDLSIVVTLDAVSGQATRYPTLTEDVSAGHALSGNAVRVSLESGGRTLVFEHADDELSGDHVARKNLTVRLVDLDTQAIGASVLLQKGIVGSALSAEDFFVTPGPHRLAISSPERTLWQDQSGVTHHGDRRGLLMIDGAGTGGVFLENDGKTKTLVRSPLSGGTSEPIAKNVDRVLGTDDLSFVIAGKIPTDGVRYPDQPGVSHAQLWETTRIDASGERLIATATQPLSPLWVGQDGSCILRGALAETPLPKIAAPADMPVEVPGFHVFDAQGTHLATVDDEGAQTIVATKRGIATDGFQVSQGYRFGFVSSAGQRTALAEAATQMLGSVQERFVDRSGEILVVQGQGNGAIATRVVLAGALPR